MSAKSLGYTFRCEGRPCANGVPSEVTVEGMPLGKAREVLYERDGWSVFYPGNGKRRQDTCPVCVAAFIRSIYPDEPTT